SRLQRRPVHDQPIPEALEQRRAATVPALQPLAPQRAGVVFQPQPRQRELAAPAGGGAPPEPLEHGATRHGNPAPAPPSGAPGGPIRGAQQEDTTPAFDLERPVLQPRSRG